MSNLKVPRLTMLLAGAAFAASITAAAAEPPALTIEIVRMEAASGLAPLIQEIEQLNRCPGVRPLDQSTPDENAQARAAGIPMSVLWLRLNDAKFAKCLGK